MLLWNETLDKIEKMELVKHDGKFTVLINGKYIERDFDKPLYFDTPEIARWYINAIKDGIDAHRIGVKLIQEREDSQKRTGGKINE